MLVCSKATPNLRFLGGQFVHSVVHLTTSQVPFLTLTLPLRSVLVLQGASADMAQSAIPSATDHRYAVTFRRTRLY